MSTLFFSIVSIFSWESYAVENVDYTHSTLSGNIYTISSDGLIATTNSTVVDASIIIKNSIKEIAFEDCKLASNGDLVKEENLIMNFKKIDKNKASADAAIASLERQIQELLQRIEDLEKQDSEVGGETRGDSRTSSEEINVLEEQLKDGRHLKLQNF